jgi:hypothetical protein
LGIRGSKSLFFVPLWFKGVSKNSCHQSLVFCQKARYSNFGGTNDAVFPEQDIALRQPPI